MIFSPPQKNHSSLFYKMLRRKTIYGVKKIFPAKKAPEAKSWERKGLGVCEELKGRQCGGRDTARAWRLTASQADGRTPGQP